MSRTDPKPHEVAAVVQAFDRLTQVCVEYNFTVISVIHFQDETGTDMVCKLAPGNMPQEYSESILKCYVMSQDQSNRIITR